MSKNDEEYLRELMWIKTPYNLRQSSDIMMFITSLPLHLLTGPAWWTGYWQERRGLKYLPKLSRCLGQTVMFTIWSRLRLNWPARARISSYSVIFNLERWQLLGFVCPDYIQECLRYQWLLGFHRMKTAPNLTENNAIANRTQNEFWR